MSEAIYCQCATQRPLAVIRDGRLSVNDRRRGVVVEGIAKVRVSCHWCNTSREILLDRTPDAAVSLA